MGEKKPVTLDEVRKQLAAAEAQIDDVASREGSSLADAVDFRSWQASHSQALAEADRLSRLVTKIESEAASVAARAAEDAQTKIEAAANRAADAAATLIVKNLKLISSLTREMLELVASADLKILEAQGTRSPDLPGLVLTEPRVRYVTKIEQRIVSEVLVDRWCFEESGDVLSGQLAASVFTADGKSGHCSGGLQLHKVRKRKFRKVVLEEEIAAAVALPLAETMVVPALRDDEQPGWIPILPYNPATVLQMLEQTSGPVPSPTRTREQLVPVDEAENVPA